MGRCNRVLVKNGKNVASDGVDLLQGNAHAVGKITPIARIGHVRGLDFVGEGLVMDMGQTDSSAFDLPEHHFTAQNAALYAPNNDPVELAKLVLELADDPQKRERMGRIGRQRIETQLAWSYQADNLLNVYESLGMILAKRQSLFSRRSSL